MVAEMEHRYVIVGGGLAGASAVEGIRERDPEGSILLLAGEPHLPYHRPPLTKGLWTGQEKPEGIFVHDEEYYQRHAVELHRGVSVASVDAPGHAVIDTAGRRYRYEKLLLATGGTPRHLAIPGGDLEGIAYYRTLNDYQRTRAVAGPDKRAVVIGGGFIGSEIAAALNMNQVAVTMVYPDDYLAAKVFPESLGRALQEQYRARGIRILHHDRPTAIEQADGRFVTQTEQGERLESELLIAGIGITPNTVLAETAGLTLTNGILVNERLQSSDPDIYAAGDNAFFPYQALGQYLRVEHWDNALNQGKQAGRNMAGADEEYTYMPFFYSDLFEFGYEAVGDVSTRRLAVFADWQQENETGVLYYHQDWVVRGVLLCNVWEKVDAARALIRAGETLSPERLRGAIMP